VVSDREQPRVGKKAGIGRIVRDRATLESIVALAFAIVAITVGFIVQALRRGYGFPMYLLQADYLVSIIACSALSVALMWRWRRRLRWFQVPMAPVMTYTLLTLIGEALRVLDR
jgi:uncharacterized membrane protein